jgi:hypothetical protein
VAISTFRTLPKFGLDLFRFPEKGDNTIVYVGGEHCKMREYTSGVKRLGKPYSRNRTVQKMYDDVMESLKLYLNDKPKERSRRLKELDRFSLGDYLRGFVKPQDQNLHPITHKPIPKNRN